MRAMLDAAVAHTPKFVAKSGLSRALVERISADKGEPEWMLEKRLKALKLFEEASMPMWGPDLSALRLDEITYYVRPDAKEVARWDEVPAEIRQTFEDLGIPEAERTALAGVGAQFDSDMVYHKLRDDLAAQGVIFLNMDEAVRLHPDLVREHFMTGCVPVHDHTFTMLHAAVWSGGTFIYVPKGVTVEIPLQAYFRMNTAHGGQFEHTLIVADEGSRVHYIEGCSAPRYEAAALHAGCVEIFVKKGARVTYSSIENWSKNTYNLNTKRAVVDEEGEITWLNGNLGSATTMLYPMSVLRGCGAKSDYLGFAFAGEGQVQDTGHKVALVAPDTSAHVRSKSIAAQGGVSHYRGLVKVSAGAANATVHVACDGLMLDSASMSAATPVIEVQGDGATVAHEASVGRIGDAEMAYCALRGIDEAAARRTIVSGFVDPVVSTLPLEYAVELVKLLELELVKMT